MNKRRFGLAVFVVAVLAIAVATPAMAHEGEDRGGDGDAVDETHLPLGQTVTQPEVGSLWTCRTNFGGAGGGPALAEGSWFNDDGTWDKTEKSTVNGDVAWPNAKLTVTKRNGKVVITTNDLPTNHTTGKFPISSSDDAYQFDRNPNSIAAQSITLELPLKPKVASSPSCIGGEVGIFKSGVVVFSAVDAAGRDAVAYEVQDDCDGHPQVSSEYHYHSVSNCVLAKLDKGTGQSKQIGWAFDGFGIYGPRNAKGEELTNADLDECHGTTSTVVFNGKKQRIYHYVATQEFPYTVGCFKGTSTVNGPTSGGGGGGGGPGGPPPPP